MKGRFSKSYFFCTSISIEDLKSLNDFICKEYEQVEYSISTNNGAIYNSISYEEIIQFDNNDHKKIVQIQIKAQAKSPSTRFTLPDFEISITDLNKSTASISYSINNALEKEIEYRSHKINELTKNFKAKYSWLHQTRTKITLIIFLHSCFFIPVQLYLTDKIEPTQLLIYSLVSPIILAWPLFILTERVIEFLFPKTIFRIGKQEEFSKKKEELRKNLLWGIFIAIFIGIITSIVTTFITKSI